jgi:hypothetical protein
MEKRRVEATANLKLLQENPRDFDRADRASYQAFYNPGKAASAR